MALSWKGIAQIEMLIRIYNELMQVLRHKYSSRFKDNQACSQQLSKGSPTSQVGSPRPTPRPPSDKSNRDCIKHRGEPLTLPLHSRTTQSC